MTPKRAAWPLAAAAVFLAVLAFAALVMIFVFAYMAIADPGPSPRLSDAASLTFLLTMVTAFCSFVLGAVAVEVSTR